MGAKRPLNGTSKVNTHTDKQTDIWTFRLIESIGPEGRCFENCYSKTVTAGDLEFLDNVHHPSVSSVACHVSNSICHITCHGLHDIITPKLVMLRLKFFEIMFTTRVCVLCPFTKSLLFQRNRLTCSGNPSFKSCLEVKAQQR